MRRHALHSTIMLTICILGATSSAQSATPTQFDWVSKGAVTPVKNQGQCGSSYAFAVVGAIEGALARGGKGLNSLSEQEIVDCSGTQGNHGCDGGNAASTFRFAKEHGLSAENVYPYTARDGVCRQTRALAGITGSSEVQTTMIGLMTAIGKQPIAAFTHISTEPGASDMYKNSVVCPQGPPNQWVLIVGYGTDVHGNPYWLIKSSWGTGWGRYGYAWIERSGTCRAFTEAWVPHI